MVAYRCMWDGKLCEDDDFQIRLTDFGVCHTFNSGLGGREIKNAIHTGTEQAAVAPFVFSPLSNWT